MWPKTDKQAKLLNLAQMISVEISKTAAEHDKDNSFPHSHFELMQSTGYLKSAVPEAYGGPGHGLTDLTLAQYAIATGDGSTALGVGMHHMAVGTEAISKKWPEHLRKRLFESVLTHGSLLNNIASEPELGSPRGGGRPATTLVPDGDGKWLLNGRKTWSTLAPQLTYAITFAAVEDGSNDTARIAQRMDAPGISIAETWDSMSMRATGSQDIIFENVKVDADDFIQRGNSKSPSNDGIDGAAWFPLLLSAANLGVASAACDYAIDFAKNRQPTGAPAPISKIPHVHEQVARMESLRRLSKNTVMTCAEDWEFNSDDRPDLLPQISMTKLSSINSAIEITDLAISIVGGAALEKSRPLERYFRDVRSGLFNPPIEGRALEQIAASVLDKDK
ncbi:MAG: acyl-CoA dehydrogenase family protein [Chloroflexota bacterium]|nr:acyl-CoA dehydrogenase family protein [Chloroflexota bacterium]